MRALGILVACTCACRLHFDELPAVDDAPPIRCPDPFDPNDVAPGPAIEVATSCDALDHRLTASIATSEIDWFAAPYTDLASCDVTPMAQVVPATASTFELCTYFACANGNLVDAPCLGGVPTIEPTTGARGCCASGPMPKVRIQAPNCNAPGAPISGGNDATLHLSVRSLDVATCTGYLLEWGDS